MLRATRPRAIGCCTVQFRLYVAKLTQLFTDAQWHRFASDFEKVCRECELLWSGSSTALPYEQPHEVGQNVSAASSIRATQV